MLLPLKSIQTMKVICRDRRERSKNASAPEGRAVNSVAADIDRILSTKSLTDLVTLEKQIVAKLASNEPIDVDYWNQLLRSLRIWKAKASLKKVYASVIKNRLEILHKQQREDAETVRRKLEAVLGAGPIPVIEEGGKAGEGELGVNPARNQITYSREMDPEPLLKIRFEDRALDNIDERDFLQKIVRVFLCNLNPALPFSMHNYFALYNITIGVYILTRNGALPRDHFQRSQCRSVVA